MELSSITSRAQEQNSKKKQKNNQHCNLEKKAAPRNEVMAAMPDAGIGQRFMNDANKDERDLDRICRLLQAGPLKNEVCVAACWTPYQWDLGAPSIVFSTNKCQGELGATDKEIKKKILTFFSNYNPPAQEEKYSALEKASLKNKHHNRPPAAYSADMQVFLNARDHAKLNRDNSRAATTIKNGKFFVVKTRSNDVHAELRILEHIHWYSCENGCSQKKNQSHYISVYHCFAAQNALHFSFYIENVVSGYYYLRVEGNMELWTQIGRRRHYLPPSFKTAHLLKK